jgi:hypothetical protein
VCRASNASLHKFRSRLPPIFTGVNISGNPVQKHWILPHLVRGRLNQARNDNQSEAPRSQGGASRRGSLVHIVPLDPAYKAGFAGHVPVKGLSNYYAGASRKSKKSTLYPAVGCFTFALLISLWQGEYFLACGRWRWLTLQSHPVI